MMKLYRHYFQLGHSAQSRYTVYVCLFATTICVTSTSMSEFLIAKNIEICEEVFSDAGLCRIYYSFISA